MGGEGGEENPLHTQQLLQFSDESSNLSAFVQDVSIRMIMMRGDGKLHLLDIKEKTVGTTSKGEMLCNLLRTII